MDAQGVPQFIWQEDERLGEVQILQDEDIPVVDLQGDHQKIVKAVAEACEKWGFFQVINHGISESSFQKLFNISEEFFSLPTPEKEACNQICTRLNSCCSEDPAGIVKYGISFNPAKEKCQDLKHFLRLDCNTLEAVEECWPKNPPELKDTLTEYIHQTSALAQRLLKVMSEGLGLSQDCLFETFGPKPRKMFLLNCYPPFYNPELVKGSSAHSDPGGITLLLQDMLGGLEVCNDGMWFAVKPIKHAIVVNLGDQLQILTNGKYKSAEHRVRVHHKKSRFSLPLFYGPGLATKIFPMPEVVGDGVVKYRESITKDYLQNFFSGTLLGKKSLDYVKVT